MLFGSGVPLKNLCLHSIHIEEKGCQNKCIWISNEDNKIGHHCGN